MTGKNTSYFSYLLRLRRVGDADRPIWRISLEKPGQPDQRYFENLTALCAYLSAKMEDGPGPEISDLCGDDEI